MQNTKMKIYLISLYIMAFFAFIVSYKNHFALVYEKASIEGIFVFIFLAVLAESLIIVYKELAISPGFAITIASTMLFGVFWGMVVTAIGTAFRVAKKKNKIIYILNTPIYKTLFNVSALSLSVFIASSSRTFLFRWNNFGYSMDVFLQFTAFVVVFLFINSLFISIIVSILQNAPVVKTYIYHLRLGFINIVFAAPFGILLFLMYWNFGSLGAFIALGPIILLRYILKLYID